MEFDRCFSCMEKISTFPCPHCGYDPGAESAFPYALRPGMILNGKFVVGTVLGQGGFGITYSGWDLSLECKVAIKEYFPSAQVSRTQSSQGILQWYNTEAGRTARDSGREMFLKEARKMARVRDIPQVVRVLDLFQQNNTAYIVMDFVEGETLKNRLKKTGPLPWEAAKEIFLPAIEAMERVHKAGLIHRDLSPDNLMLTPDGSVRILDLGAAKDLNINTGASSMQVAKGGFSPMEQYIQTGGSGSWTDVYAMAATMYYTLTGVLPLPSVDRMAEDTLRWDLPQLAALPENVLTALQKAMAVFPKARTQSMAEFSSQLTAPVTVQPRQPERKVEPDRDKETEAKAVENKKPEATPAPKAEPKAEPKKEPAPKEKDVSRDTAASKEPEHPDGASGKARKRLPVIAAVLVLLVVASGILIWNMKNAPAGSASSGKNPVQMQETEGYSPTENNTDKTLDDASAEAYAAAEALAQNGESAKAAMAFYALGDYQDARERSFALWDTVAVRDTVSAGAWKVFGLREDGTVAATGSNVNGSCNVDGWSDIISVSAQGNSHTVGLKADGTVVAAGYPYVGQCDVGGWTDIVAVVAGGNHTVGLRADGTVVATGYNEDGQCEVGDWTDIVAISASEGHTVGLKIDGTVVATGRNADGQCDIQDWTDIVAISAEYAHTVGLKADGTVVAVGNNSSGECDVAQWKNIIAISAGICHTVGLRSDGTVVATGLNRDHVCDVSKWTDIVAVSTCHYHTAGLKADGTVVVVGTQDGVNPDGTLAAPGSKDAYYVDTSTWKDIRLP